MKKITLTGIILIMVTALAVIFSCDNGFVASILPSRDPVDAKVPVITVQPQNAAVPVIIVQPQGATYSAGGVAQALTVAASAADGGTLSYQWYRNTVDSNEGGTEIPGATGASYAPPTAVVGAVYYYVVVTNTIADNGDGGNKTAQAASDTAGIGVGVKSITITGLSAENKFYDGTTTATVAGTAVLDGVVGDDTVTVVSGTAAFADKTVGTGKTVTFSGWSLSGADAGNYFLLAQPVSVMVDITAKPVTITGLSAGNKVYDGTTAATVTGTAVINGKIPGDDVSADGTAAFDDKNAGTGKTVTFGYSLNGADAGNYFLSAQPADVTADITKAAGSAVSRPSVNGSPAGSSITVNAATLQTETGQSIEYAVSTASNGTGLSAWQGGVTFTGLNGGTAYYVYARSASNANYEAGTVNVSAGITTAVTVTFNSNGGSDVSSQTITAGDAVSRPANPSRGGYTFDYWYQNAELTIPYYFATPVTASITLYARWVTNEAVAAMAAKNIVFVAGGTFTMGSPDTEAGRSVSESPQHPVTLSGFYMGKYEVTQEQYQAVMGSNPSDFTVAVSGESGTPGKLPVERVGWYDALVFCNKLSVMEGLSPAYRISGSTDPAVWGTAPTSSNATWNAVEIVSGANGYRLPTEAQWEYACRAGTTTAFNNGNDDYTNTASVGSVGWYYSNSSSKTHQVGLKAANAWGLYDMHGNVYEWCWDWFSSSYGSSSPVADPTGAVSGAGRVIRGGSWVSSGQYLRSAYRYGDTPSNRYYYLGFRLVRP